MSRPPLPLTELSAAFRQRGALMAEISPEAARTFEFCAAWLDASREASMDAALTLAEAAAESGWSYEGLRQKLAKEPSLNAAESGAPMILRRHLPLLGAARGPRGKYQLKPKEQAAEVAPVTEGDVGRASKSDESATTAVAELSSPAAHTAAPQAHLAELSTVPSVGDASAYPPEEGSVSLASEDDPQATVTKPEAGAPRTAHGPRKATTRTRQRSAEAHFQDLCALAARS